MPQYDTGNPNNSSHDEDYLTSISSRGSFVNLPANSSSKLTVESGVIGPTTVDNTGNPANKHKMANSSSLLLKPFASSNLASSTTASSSPRKQAKRTPTGMHSRMNESGDSFKFMTRTPSNDKTTAQYGPTSSNTRTDHEYGSNNQSQSSADLNFLLNPTRPYSYRPPSLSIASGMTTGERKSSTLNIGKIESAFANGERNGNSSPTEQDFKAKPSIDYHDKLWAEIDILDDVKKMAQQTITDGSFFGKKHAEALEQLKKAQVRLAHEMCTNDKQIGEYDHRKIWEANDIESVKKTLFSQEHFNNVSECVENTLTKLNEVGEVMKVVDDRSRDMWSSSSK